MALSPVALMIQYIWAPVGGKVKYDVCEFHNIIHERLYIECHKQGVYVETTRATTLDILKYTLNTDIQSHKYRYPLRNVINCQCNCEYISGMSHACVPKSPQKNMSVLAQG